MHTILEMKATLLELRRQTNKVVEAIDKNQKVTLTRRGKSFAVITPTKSAGKGLRVKDHPAFGMHSESQSKKDVLDYMKKIRSNRYAL